MWKSLITPTRQSHRDSDRDWLVLDEVASVEVTSEAEGFPVEGALASDGQQGWRADTPGSQTIRLRFDTPRTIRFIRLVFHELKSAPNQEFVLHGFPLMAQIGGMSSGNNGISARRTMYWNAKSTGLTSPLPRRLN